MNHFFDLPNKNPVTCHVFSLDNIPSNPRFSVSPFAQKVRNLCWMLKSVGHKVIYYGYESCEVECDEKIIVGDEEVIKEAYPEMHEGLGFIDINTKRNNQQDIDYLEKMWTITTLYKLQKIHKNGDFFFWMLPGCGQRHLYYETSNWNVHHIEAGIGYIGACLPNRVFESEYIQNYHHGCYHSNNYHYEQLDENIQSQVSSSPHYLYTRVDYETPPDFDVVIPNSFDLSMYDFKTKKDDYLLYLARVLGGKGIKESVEIAEKMDMKIIVAGPGDFEKATGRKPSKNVEVIGCCRS